MKTTITRRVDAEHLAVLMVSLEDDCKNGYDVFNYVIDIYSNRRKADEPSITFHGKKYWLNGFHGEEDPLFPETSDIYTVKGCDRFGVPTCPIMNGGYHLQNDLPTGQKYLRLTKKEAKQFSNFKNLSLAKEIKKLIDTRYAMEAKKAIDCLEKLSGEKYKPKEFVSAELYNDIHYKLITEKEGWNVFKSRNAEKIITEYPIELK